MGERRVHLGERVLRPLRLPHQLLAREGVAEIGHHPPPRILGPQGEAAASSAIPAAGGIALYAWLLAPLDTRSTLRSDALATLLYVANWHQIIASQSYFVQPNAPLLHTWTLAIEEQFYLIWPLIVLGFLKWRPAVRPLAVFLLVAAVGSAVEMALLYHVGADPSRLYYGTDTRAQDLLIGAALAFLLANRQPAGRDSRWSFPAPSGSLLSPGSPSNGHNSARFGAFRTGVGSFSRTCLPRS